MSAGGNRSGRRPGKPQTKHAILEAARQLFAARGFERTTVRAVAARASVDPALVHHYFGSKDGLLEAALRPPLRALAGIQSITESRVEQRGERIVRLFLSLWSDEEEGAAYLAVVRCAASNDRAAAIMRRVIMQQIMGPVIASLGVPDAPLRANLVGSQLIGLVMARHVVRLEPIATATTETIVAAVAPTIQRYISEPLLAAGVGHKGELT